MGTGEFRRRYARKTYSSDVIFSLHDKAYAGSLKDISMGGAFVITLAAGQVTSGDTVIISIPFTNGKKNIRRRARVMWTTMEGFALAFL